MLKKIVALIKSEPAVFLGAAGTVGVAVFQLVTHQVTWNAIEPLVSGFAIRWFVSPATA